MCLLTNDWSYVQKMVWDAWVQYVVPFVRNSLQYEGLMLFHLSWIRAGYQSGQQYNSLLANYASRAIMSMEAKSHFLAVSEASCQLCGAAGGPVHLLRSCSATQHLREQGMSAELLQFSCSVGVSGLFPHLPRLDFLAKHLRELPDVPFGPYLRDDVHLCTDRSTMHGSFSKLALSSWSLVLAEEGLCERTVVSSGLLPGVVQNIARAELYAVLQAVLSAPSGFIYSDSLGTVQGFQKLQHVGFSEGL